MPVTNNIFTIAPGTPFLKRLARFVLDGELGKSLSGHDPLELSNTIIYLPTRRAVRTLRQEFSNLLGENAAFLPTLRTLGDSDEDGVTYLADLSTTTNAQRIVNPLERQIQMARLVKQWIGAIGVEARELFQDEDIIIPSSSAEALWLSKEVCDLIDQMHTEEVSWESLKDLVPQREEYANWWQLTLDFLQIAMKSWPQHLTRINAGDASQIRRQMLDLRTNLLKQSKNPAPVIAAGSTGSIPATARFLKAVSEMPNGAVVLPGLDLSLNDNDWLEISGTKPNRTKTHLEPDDPVGCEDHPQFGLSKLLNTLGIHREDVVELATPKNPLNTRSNLTSIALLPSNRTHMWRELTAALGVDAIEKATQNLTIIEAPAERQEAMTIALILRHQIETPDIHAALVTPDRKLARRVAAELKRFSLNIDDSGGANLAATPNAIFLRLMISSTTLPPDAATLASFINHPMLMPDFTETGTLPVARLFEICLLRDVMEIPAAGEYANAARERYSRIRQTSHCPQLLKKASEEDWQCLFSFCENIDTALTPLINFTTANKNVGLDQLMSCILQASSALTSTQDNVAGLFHGENGQELTGIFEEAIKPEAREFECRPTEMLLVFDALIAGHIVRSGGNTHPRISILGPLEARLQPLDCVVLGGLNEGTWPAQYSSGPFLNRPMKSTINMSTPERRTGLSAHDFEQLLGTRQVFLTRSNRIENAPTVPSRWLQRLIAVCGETTTQQMKTRGVRYLSWANAMDTPSPAKRFERPCPKPPVKYRPKGLSVTEIETWIRDPYAIYAKRILKLQPLGKIGTTSIHATYGNIWHEAVAEFTSSNRDPNEKNATGYLISLIENQIAKNKIPDHLKALWMPRIAQIAGNFIDHEQDIASGISADFCEIDGKMSLGKYAFELRGRADRLSRLNDGSIHIIDYKTGSNPTLPMARTLSPQLALEGAMVIRGGFAQLEKAKPSSLKYIRLRAYGEFKSESVESEKLDIDAAELSMQKLIELEKLVENYQNPDQGYLSRFAVAVSANITGDYDHLARVREWSLGADDAQEEVD